ncbi:MAG: CorA family divalent cation transporter [Lutimonas sp.]
MEDQYVGAGMLASLSASNLGHEYILQTNKLLKGFEPREKAMLRLEKKAKSLRLHYILLQQEKATRKINVLTIIQAIFVPLTFIAGVYGMNFVIMPELEWPLGYLMVWILFVAMATGLLVYFYRKGWFD